MSFHPVFQTERPCRVDLPGWRLTFIGVEQTGGFDPSAMDTLVLTAEGEVRKRFPSGDCAADPVLKSVRELFKQAGTSPSKYRPSSEALVRRVLKGEGLPRIFPLVDLNNVLSALTMCPCCVVKPGSVEPPLVLRRGVQGESICGNRGPLLLDGKPVLADASGPFGTPITDDHRVTLDGGDLTAILVVYEPERHAVGAGDVLRGLLGGLGCFRLFGESSSTAG